MAKGNDYWTPTLNEKQFRIFNCYKRAMLASGPKLSSKTIGCCHKVIRHATDTSNGHIGVFTKTIKVAVDGGCWTDLTKICMPQWMANTGIRYHIEPKVDGQTRQAYFEITNRHGNTSRVVLNSLDYDDDIEAVIRGKRYSMLWFNELDNFRIRKVFDVSYDQLRMVHLPYESHQWLADTNPSDEGEDSWIYKLFYEDRITEVLPEHVLKAPDPAMAEKAFRQLQDELELIEIMIPDNTFLSEQQRLGLFARFQHDKDLAARYLYGRWTSSTTDSHFADVFKPDIHVLGEASSPYEDQWEILLPEENCSELITSWDMGDVNHAITIFEPALMGGKIHFKVLDELVLLKENIGIDELTDRVLQKMNFWEGQLGRVVNWRHWSDLNAFDHFNSAANAYDYQIVYAASEGRIHLRAAMGGRKGAHSIKHRINVARRLLFYNQLAISVKCPHTIAMFRGLKKGRSMADRDLPLKEIIAASVIPRGNRHKHVFDALTYGLASEIPLEIEAVMPHTGHAPGIAVMGV